MKRLIFLLLLLPFLGYSQTVVTVSTADTSYFRRTTGTTNAEVRIRNGDRNIVNGIAYNASLGWLRYATVGNGLTFASNTFRVDSSVFATKAYVNNFGLKSGTNSWTGANTFSQSIGTTASSSILTSTYSGTAGNYLTLSNANGQSLIGVDNSTGSNFGAGNYSFNIYHVGNTNVNTWSNGLLRYQLSGAGNHNFQAGTVTIGNTLILGTNSITMTGSLGATGERLTKGWFTDLEVTNAIAGSITGSAPAGSLTGTTLASNVVTSSITTAALANLTATNSTLTFSGSYNGNTARTVGLNLGNANDWTASQTITSSSLPFKLTASGSQSEILRLVSKDAVGDTWLGFYRSGEATRKGYLGFGNGGDDVFKIWQEENAEMQLGVNGTLSLTLSPSTGATHAGALGIGGVANSVTSDTYVPTVTGVANISSVTPTDTRWMRIGNVVTVSGLVIVAPTAGSATTSFRVSLPVASNLAAYDDLTGPVSWTSLDINGGQVTADFTNDEALVSISLGASGASFNAVFEFKYTIF